MVLYIEKGFLDHFFLSYSEVTASRSEKALFSILKEYGDVTWYIDVTIETPEDLEELKQENPFFAFRTNTYPPIPISNFKEHFQKSGHRQTLILSERDKEWFNEAEHSGALSLTLENYQEKIERLLEEGTVKIDLFEKFPGWEALNFHNLFPFNEIVISDGYILKNEEKMGDNIIPLLNVLLKNTSRTKPTIVKIITKEFNPKNGDNEEKIKEAAKKRYKRLKRTFKEKNVQFQVIRFDKASLPSEYDLHDRIICCNFHFIECGKGFNLMPPKISDSRIIAENIFDKFSYRTLKNRIKLYDMYIETLKKAPSNKFTAYPPIMN
ncbi:hypothetical protein [uncultured Salegentibacter sp.]|uniref:hypothetical protein n=1 Tax=uncultured Salegentibacter sp. TaxID=259320 RepID=UPI002599210E|nr:hypothetical protein [uncultured Salegentibacter sp.]